MDPESGYSGAIVKVLGRNFSEKAKDNVVLIGGKEAKVLDANKWDLTIVVPENEPAEYEVEVTTPAGKAGGIKFLYKEKPEHVYLASIYAGQAGKNWTGHYCEDIWRRTSPSLARCSRSVGRTLFLQQEQQSAHEDGCCRSRESSFRIYLAEPYGCKIRF